jgi:hypothetical protein
VLPEARPGPALDEAAAKTRARRALIERFHVADTALKEVSAVPSKLTARTDWTMTYADTTRPLPQGEARLSARISGDEIASTARFVYVPEEWERNERNRQTVAQIVSLATGLLTGIMVFGGVIAAIVSWSRRRFAVRLFLTVFAMFLVLTAVRLVNNFPTVMANLVTTQPLRLQLAILVGVSAVGLAFLSGGMALIAGAAPRWTSSIGRLDARQAIAIGAALGALAAAARVLGASIGSHEPVWPSYGNAGTLAPLVGAAVSPVVTMSTRLVVLLLLAAGVERVTAGWTRRRALGAAALWILGGVLGASASPEYLLPWLASAAIVGALLVAAYVFVLREDFTVVPFAAAVMTMTGTLREGWSRGFPGALAGSIVAVILMGALAYWWVRALRAAKS